MTVKILPIMWLIPACIFDYKYRRIPNKITYSMLIAGMLFSFIFGKTEGLINSFTGVLTSILWILLFRRAFCMGGGDIKLLAACGAWLGKTVLFAILYASAALVLYNIILYIQKEGWKCFLRRIKIEFLYGYHEPFGTLPGAFFISLGFILALLF